MRKVILIASVITVAAMALIGGMSYADDEYEPLNVGNTTCPVMGTKVEPGKSLTVVYNDKIYNLCCQSCVKEFAKDPEKYSAIAEGRDKK